MPRLKIPNPKFSLSGSREKDSTTVLKDFRRRRGRGGRTVYIGMKVKPRGQPIEACRGLSIRAFDFTPREVHNIIIAALTEAAKRSQAEQRAKRRGEELLKQCGLADERKAVTSAERPDHSS